MRRALSLLCCGHALSLFSNRQSRMSIFENMAYARSPKTDTPI